MESTVPFSFDYTCRACMSQNDVFKQLFNESNEASATIPTMFESISTLQIQPDDQLPSIICTTCYISLLNAYNFRKMCLETDRKLHELLMQHLKFAIIKNEVVDQRNHFVENTDQNNELYCVEVKNELAYEIISHDDSISIDDSKENIQLNISDEGLIPPHSSDLLNYNEDMSAETNSRDYSQPPTVEQHTNDTVSTQDHFQDSCATDGNLHAKRKKKGKTHACPTCKEVFQKSCTLKDHLSTHSSEPTYPCPECGKAFNDRSNLSQHKQQHIGAKPFACTECPSHFRTMSARRHHMRTHTKEKPYSCDQCAARFSQTNYLKKHKRIHTGEKSYSCKFCGKSFFSSNNVKRHMRTHTGEKPYRCMHCSRRFVQTNDLVRHMRSHVGEKTYCCEACSVSFRLKSELQAHMQGHFKEGELETKIL